MSSVLKAINKYDAELLWDPHTPNCVPILNSARVKVQVPVSVVKSAGVLACLFPPYRPDLRLMKSCFPSGVAGCIATHIPSSSRRRHSRHRHPRFSASPRTCAVEFWRRPSDATQHTYRNRDHVKAFHLSETTHLLIRSAPMAAPTAIDSSAGSAHHASSISPSSVGLPSLPSGRHATFCGHPAARRGPPKCRRPCCRSSPPATRRERRCRRPRGDGSGCAVQQRCRTTALLCVKGSSVSDSGPS